VIFTKLLFDVAHECMVCPRKCLEVFLPAAIAGLNCQTSDRCLVSTVQQMSCSAMTFMQLQLSSISVWFVVDICNGKDGSVGYPLSTLALMLPQDVFRKWL
jgi:hypothetical protein